MEIENLEFREILQMTKSIKILAIKQLIDAIAQDEVENAVSHFETQEEQERYLNYIKKWFVMC